MPVQKVALHMGITKCSTLKDRNIDQWNKIESPEVNPCTYGHHIFDKGGKNILQRKDNFFKWCWENWSITCKGMELEQKISQFVRKHQRP